MCFQVQFVSRHGRPHYLPSEAVMAEWKSKLFTVSSVQEGIQVITNLKLTVFKILAFAEYLGVSLSGCEYVKSEIVKRLVERSLEARKDKENDRLHSNNAGQVSISEEEVNQLLSGQWVSLDISHEEGKPVFVLGLPYQFGMDAYCAGAVFTEA